MPFFESNCRFLLFFRRSFYLPELHLTPIEYKLLCLLSKNVGKVLTHQFITQNIWGKNWGSNQASLRVFIATLRKKLEPNKDLPEYIQTHIGVGYRIVQVDESHTRTA